MLPTKEKIVALVAVILALAFLADSFGDYRLPEAVPEPADAERALAFEPDEQLVPALQPRTLWAGSGRNPFSVRDLYETKAPVPLSLPPALPALEFLPAISGSGELVPDRVVAAPGVDIDPEPKVSEPDDTLPAGG